MDINALRKQALEAIAAADELAELEHRRVSYLGKKGEVTQQLKQLGAMPAEQRKVAGQQINALKKELFEAINGRKEALEQAAIAERTAREAIDVTLPGR